MVDDFLACEKAQWVTSLIETRDNVTLCTMRCRVMNMNIYDFRDEPVKIFIILCILTISVILIQMMDGEMQTLSLGNWMELPNEPFKPWIQRRNSIANERYLFDSFLDLRSQGT